MPCRSMRSCVLLALTLASTAWAHAGSKLVENAAQRLEALGTHKLIAQRAAKHVALGMPSKPSRQDTNDYLLVRNEYVISYNGTRNILNWASWLLTASDVSTMDRKKEKFRHDPTLPKGKFAVITSADHRLAGRSRGHWVRSRERTSTPRANAKTYVFTNMVPQALNNNTGPWNDLENYYLELARQNYDVYLIAGGSDYDHQPPDVRQVAVPGNTWKIVVLIPPGKTLDDIDEHTRVIAVSMPNDNDKIKVEHDWARYRVSIADLEKQQAAPLPFFDALPAHVQAALKNRVDAEVIPPPPPREFRPHNFGEQPTGPDLVVVQRQLEGRVKFYSPDKRYGWITGPDGTSIWVHARNRLTSIAADEVVTFDLAKDDQGRFSAVAVRSHSPKATPENVPDAPSKP